MPDEISLRDAIRERLDLERQVRDERHAAYRIEQELLAQQCNERWAAHAKVHELEGEALELQAKENERRLETLNHDHANTRTTQQTFLPREVYAADRKDDDTRLRNLEKFQNNLTGRLLVIGALVAILTAVVVALISRAN